MKLKRNSKSKSRRRSLRKSRKSKNVIHRRSHKRNRSRKSRCRSRRKSKRRSRSRRIIIKYKIPDGLSKPIYDFKLIELKGCGYCKDAKKLILDNNYTLEVKQTLTPEEENKVKEYPYYPKIFKYNKTSKIYDFIGGFDKLKDLLKK